MHHTTPSLPVLLQFRLVSKETQRILRCLEASEKPFWLSVLLEKSRDWDWLTAWHHISGYSISASFRTWKCGLYFEVEFKAFNFKQKEIDFTWPDFNFKCEVLDFNRPNFIFEYEVFDFDSWEFNIIFLSVTERHISACYSYINSIEARRAYSFS